MWESTTGENKRKGQRVVCVFSSCYAAQSLPPLPEFPSGIPSSRLGWKRGGGHVIHRGAPWISFLGELQRKEKRAWVSSSSPSKVISKIKHFFFFFSFYFCLSTMKRNRRFQSIGRIKRKVLSVDGRFSLIAPQV